MIGSSKNKSENYPRKCFRTQEKETRVKFNPRLSADRPSNNWAQEFKGDRVKFTKPYRPAAPAPMFDVCERLVQVSGRCCSLYTG